MRIEKAFGVNMDTLLRMQLAYDIALTRQNEKKIKVKRYVQLSIDEPREIAPHPSRSISI